MAEARTLMPPSALGAPSPTTPPSLVLAVVIAFFATCPVLLHLFATYVADGNSFADTGGGTCAALALAGLAALRIGLPLRELGAMHGPTLALACIAGLFWSHWILLNVLSPSPQAQMANLPIQGVLWLSLPMLLCFLWRNAIDMAQLARVAIVLSAVYIIALTGRFVLGLGHYQSGRWHPGDALESIRAGHYAGSALWIFLVACVCPARLVPGWFKLVAFVSIPLAAFMVVATNSRGPALSLAATILCTSVPLAKILAGRISRDARLLVVLLVGVSVTALFIASQLGSVESDFARMTTLTRDGGSAQTRVTLWQDHMQLISDTPWGVISGFGYDHGLFYPHNVLIEALVDGGVLSFGLALGMIFVALRAWFAPRLRGDELTLLFGGIFIFDLIGSQVSGSIPIDSTWYGALLLVLRHEEVSERRGYR